ncbi:MAG: AAA family ATPase [Lachnospiraceae bacterium]|nr:AAA family ATPase [Lachnospiraceae bacterium]
MDDLFGNMNSRKASYSEKDIDAARKLQKKNGGTLMENLELVAPGKGRKAYSPDSAKIEFQGIEQSLGALMAQNNARAASLDETIRNLSANIESDFGVKSDQMQIGQIGAAAQKAEDIEVPVDNAKALESFAGLSDVLLEKIHGQDDFIKKLIIAFKRPFVSERDGNDALNSIYITGPSCTGKHYALQTIVDELGKRGVLKGDGIYTMDLSLYPSAGEEKLFLQDIYAALKSSAKVIVFENYEACHVSTLTKISDLVTTGECRLSERYIMQGEKLVSVTNALAGDTVGSFEARGKYLVFVSSRPLDKLAGVMGAPFVNALGDVCATRELDEGSLKKISEEQETQMTEKASKQLGFEVKPDKSFREYVLSQSSKSRALKGILDAYADTIKALAELKLERDDLPGGNEIKLSAKGDKALIISGKETIEMRTLLPDSYNGELDAVKQEMDSIVGLTKIKEYIFSLEEYYEIQKRRREEGLKAGEVNKHMIFTGNPGTGKTTIARIVSRYLKAIGVLSGGQLVEVSRGDLVGRYAGHTAPLVNQVVKSALGGVLFIDEAYSLYRGEDDSFGLEAIDALVKCIEDNRDDLIVILAGYSMEMEEFLQANSGLKSRFPNIIDFPDYTGDELVEISKLTAKSKGYVINEDVLPVLKEFFEKVQATNAREAGNGRLVRNKVEEAILNQSRRLVAEPDADMSELTMMDFVLEQS